METGHPSQIDMCHSVPPIREFLLMVAFVLFGFACFIVYLFVHDLLTIENTVILLSIFVTFILAHLYQRWYEYKINIEIGTDDAISTSSESSTNYNSTSCNISDCLISDDFIHSLLFFYPFYF